MVTTPPKAKTTGTAVGLNVSAVPQRQSLVTTVVEALAAQIQSGAVKPGSRLPAESELSTLFDVSRTVVREAVARLKAEGQVETVRGQGLFVTRPGPGHGVLRLKPPEGNSTRIASELLEFRAGLETHAAWLAASRRTETDIQALQKTLDALTTAKYESTVGGGAEEDLAFHLAIARASHNTYIVQVLEYLSSTLHTAISKSREHDAGRLEFVSDADAEHRAVFNAIVEGKADEAYQAMQCHLEAGQKRVLAWHLHVQEDQ